MKKVYLVKERSKVNGRVTEFCGMSYYSSYKKALEDYNNRKQEKQRFFEQAYEEVEKGSFLVTHSIEFLDSDNNYEFQIVLESHEVY